MRFSDARRHDIATAPGAAELRKLVGTLWPDIRIDLMNAGQLCAWLNYKTGLRVSITAPAHFQHWLPTLRQMVKAA